MKYAIQLSAADHDELSFSCIWGFRLNLMQVGLERLV